MPRITKGSNEHPNRGKNLKKYNNSAKGREAKLRWVAKDPMRAWIVNALGRARQRAKRSGVAFDLDFGFLKGLAVSNCPVLGVELVYGNSGAGPGGVWNSASVDRIKPDAGYVRGNVVIISRRANVVKSDASVDEIEAIARWLRRHQGE